MNFNPTPLVVIAVVCGIGYLMNGIDGAVLGGVIMGSIVGVGTVIFSLSRR